MNRFWVVYSAAVCFNDFMKDLKTFEKRNL